MYITNEFRGGIFIASIISYWIRRLFPSCGVTFLMAYRTNSSNKDNCQYLCFNCSSYWIDTVLLSAYHHAELWCRNRACIPWFSSSIAEVILWRCSNCLKLSPGSLFGYFVVDISRTLSFLPRSSIWSAQSAMIRWPASVTVTSSCKQELTTATCWPGSRTRGWTAENCINWKIRNNLHVAILLGCFATVYCD